MSRRLLRWGLLLIITHLLDIAIELLLLLLAAMSIVDTTVSDTPAVKAVLADTAKAVGTISGDAKAIKLEQEAE